ncbi:MAG: 50S ribosomal protein L6 [Planctomycetes bacterium]|nr:50S ribosomal protein L6 [Planctomycetota bacterium]
MSRVGKKPVPVPEGVTVAIKGQTIDVSGPKGKLSWSAPAAVALKHDADRKCVDVTRRTGGKQAQALHGTSRALIANLVEGVTKGFEKRLLIYGTGYGCNVRDNKLELNVGFVGRGTKDKPQFSIEILAGLEIQIETPAARGDTDPAKLVVRGCDKELVGRFAAQIRKLRPPEPYKGKGIRYEGEHVRRKQGKALAGAS